MNNIVCPWDNMVETASTSCPDFASRPALVLSVPLARYEEYGPNPTPNERYFVYGDSTALYNQSLSALAWLNDAYARINGIVVPIQWSAGPTFTQAYIALPLFEDDPGLVAAEMWFVWNTVTSVFYLTIGVYDNLSNDGDIHPWILRDYTFELIPKNSDGVANRIAVWANFASRTITNIEGRLLA